jgi:hypothetical protein
MKFPVFFKILLSLCLLGTAKAYTPPPGIPDPATSTIGGATPFGWEIDRAVPDWPASWTAGTPSATTGYYYVDNTHGSATNTSNPYGYPGKPRLTPPTGSTLALASGGGAYIYFHGGTYTVATMSGTWQMHGVGTSSTPIWIVGNPLGRPIIQVPMHFGYGDASFFIVSDMIFSYSNVSGTDRFGRIDIRPVATSVTADHILVRNSAFTGKVANPSSGGISIGGSNSDKGAIDFNVESVVVYNCLIHTMGEPTVANSEQCGIYKAGRSRWAWALNNTIYAVGADCIAGAHGGNDTDYRSEWYFIGGNSLAHPNPTLLTSGENCIDIKSTRYVIISSNYCRGLFGREQGWAIVVHSSSTPTPVRDGWFLFNTVHHASVGIATTSTTGGYDTGFVGNLIYDIKSSYAVQADPLNGAGILHRVSYGPGNYIADNTIYDYEDGIVVSSLGAGNTCAIHGNILNNRSDVNGHDLLIETGTDYAMTDYNFWPSTSRIRWGNSIWTQTQFKANTAHEAHGLSGDPLFTNPLSGDYSLKADSRAKDSSVEGPVGSSAYEAFRAIYGENIKKDTGGGVRPAGVAWDMGAYEADSGGVVSLQPSPPTGFKVVPK